jgi:phosphoribosylformylglycinamidine cyclo-ligase
MPPSEPTQPLTYRAAGLDLDVYERTIAGMVPLLRRTHTPRILDGFGGFASLFSLDYNTRLFARNYRRPVLVACTDGRRACRACCRRAGASS